MEKNIVPAGDFEGMCMALSVVQQAVERNDSEYTFVCSYDMNTRDGAERRERHECDVEDNGKKHVNSVLEIIHFTLTKTQLPNDQGELQTLPLLTLETKTGQLVNLFSAPALRCFISRLRTHLMDGALNEKHPIKLKLVNRETSNKRSMYWFDRP